MKSDLEKFDYPVDGFSWNFISGRGEGGVAKLVFIVKFELKSNKTTDVSHDGVHTFMTISRRLPRTQSTISRSSRDKNKTHGRVQQCQFVKSVEQCLLCLIYCSGLLHPWDEAAGAWCRLLTSICCRD